ncbi:MAG: hypothetical protein ACRD2P_04745, partial [Terriglobia bacterium]
RRPLAGGFQRVKTGGEDAAATTIAMYAKRRSSLLKFDLRAICESRTHCNRGDGCATSGRYHRARQAAPPH